MGPLGVVVVFLLGVVLGLLAMVAFVVVAFVLPVPKRRTIENGNENGTNTTPSTNPMSDSASLLPPTMTSSLASLPVVVGGIISGPGTHTFFFYFQLIQ